MHMLVTQPQSTTHLDRATLLQAALESDLGDSTVYIHSEGESLSYDMYWKENGELQTHKLNAQTLGHLVSGTRQVADVDVVTIYANSVETMSGILKQIAALRAWGSYICFVKFEVRTFA